MNRFVGATLAVLIFLLPGAVLGQAVQAPGAFGAIPVTASATGTTLATAATIPAVTGKKAYLCGFSARSNATAAASGDLTVVGLVSGTLHFTHFTAPVTSGVGVTEPPIGPACIPASAANVAIVVTAPAAGSSGVESVSAWGFYQ